jgi:hypothetical protein
MTPTQLQRGRICFEAFETAIKGHDKWVWDDIMPHQREAWCEAAEAVYQTTQCHFDQGKVFDPFKKIE